MALSVLLVLSLAACATVRRLDAAGDVHALLVAIRDDDAQTFDVHVDRPALQAEVEARLGAEAGKLAKRKGWGALGALVAPDLARAAGEVLIQPRTFRAAAEAYGYDPARPLPNQIAIAGALKALPDGRVCATRKKDGPCFLVFTREDGVWKLSGFEGDVSGLRLKL